MPWDGGVFVSNAPDLLYLKDTTGDGVADERRVVLTGFDATRTAQIRFSHPTLGIDNWVYLTSGLTGGNVTAPEHPDRPPVKFTSSDSRFNPFTHAFELTGGQGQYGLTFDDHGRRFTCSNRRPVMHVVLEPRYLKRNPHLAFSATVQDVSTAGAQAVVWPISADMTTASFHPSLMSTPHAGTFTAASGVHIHRGDALPPSHRDSIFICESAQNLVQRQIRSSNGVTFTSRPARDGREFLASRDHWFRPVFAANGPDGALYIVDMYRKIIDHPQYVPEQSRPLLDFEAGKGQRPDLSDRRPELEGGQEADRSGPDGRRRAVADSRTSECLVAGDGPAPARGAPRSARGPASSARSREEGRSEVARIHALWTLEGLGGLEAADIARALRDPHAGGARERRPPGRSARARRPRICCPTCFVLRMIPTIASAFASALALGETDDPRAIDALASIARRDGAQSWMRAAILSSVERSVERVPSRLRRLTASVRRGQGGGDAGPRSTVRRGSDARTLSRLDRPDRRSGCRVRLAAGGAVRDRAGPAGAGTRRGEPVGVHDAACPPIRRRRARPGSAWRRVLSRASALALDETAPADLRLAAIGLMGHTDYSSAGKTLEACWPRSILPRFRLRLSVRCRSCPDRAAAASLVEPGRWLAFTPQVREAVLSALVADEDRTLVLLDAVEKGSITAGRARVRRAETG